MDGCLNEHIHQSTFARNEEQIVQSDFLVSDQEFDDRLKIIGFVEVLSWIFGRFSLF